MNGVDTIRAQALGIGTIVAKMGEALSCGIELVQAAAISPNPKKPSLVFIGGHDSITTQALGIGVIVAKTGEALS